MSLRSLAVASAVCGVGLAASPPAITLESAATQRFSFAPSATGIALPDASLEQIGRIIWHNETGGSARELTHWNRGETFASLGLGHFIWYPAGHPCLSAPKPGETRKCFVESFPQLVAFLKAERVTLPAWTLAAAHCPWADKAAFDAALDGPELTALRQALLASFVPQTRFIVKRLEAALPAMLDEAPAPERAELERRFRALAADPVGLYALIDYVNFKGEGVSPAERRNGQGWGLLQALQGMKPDPNRRVCERFADGAAAALRRRVANAAPSDLAQETKWLPGWLKRVDRYRAAKLEDIPGGRP